MYARGNYLEYIFFLEIHAQAYDKWDIDVAVLYFDDVVKQEYIVILSHKTTKYLRDPGFELLLPHSPP